MHKRLSRQNSTIKVRKCEVKRPEFYLKPRLASHPSFFPICNFPVLPRLRMCDQIGSSTICVLPLHIAIPTPELLLVNIMCSVSHQIPIGVLLSQPPCVPVNWLLGTLARHFDASQIKIFLSNAWVSHCWATHTSLINITRCDSQHRKAMAHSCYT